MSQYWSELEERVRQQPSQYLVLALVIGVLIRAFPIGAILGLLFRVIGILLKPALIVLALANVARLITERQQGTPLIITPSSPGGPG